MSRETTGAERTLAAVFLAIALCLVLLDARSRLASGERSRTPAFVWLSLRSKTDPASPPVFYLVSYSWSRRSLDLVYAAPPTAPETAKMVLSRITGDCPTFDMEVPANSPQAVKAGILSWSRNPRFWRGLSRYDAILAALEAYRLAPADVHMIWLPDEYGIPRLAGRLLGGAPDPRASPDPRPNAASPITVEVLNASGIPRVALLATKVLRWQGFDVREFGNADSPAEASEFLDRIGDPEPARKIALALGCPKADITTRMDSRQYPMVTVILGRDYKACRGLSKSEAAAESAAPSPGPEAGGRRSFWRRWFRHDSGV